MSALPADSPPSQSSSSLPQSRRLHYLTLALRMLQVDLALFFATTAFAAWTLYADLDINGPQWPELVGMAAYSLRLLLHLTAATMVAGCCMERRARACCVAAVVGFSVSPILAATHGYFWIPYSRQFELLSPLVAVAGLVVGLGLVRRRLGAPNPGINLAVGGLSAAVLVILARHGFGTSRYSQWWFIDHHLFGMVGYAGQRGPGELQVITQVPLAALLLLAVNETLSVLKRQQVESPTKLAAVFD